MTTDYGDTFAAWAEAFTLFAKYETGRAQISAEHDELYAGPAIALVSAKDKARLEELGWDIDEQFECFHHFV